MYQRQRLYRSFCGSGTLLIEAAMLAMNMAPGANRAFQAERWLMHSQRCGRLKENGLFFGKN